MSWQLGILLIIFCVLIWIVFSYFKTGKKEKHKKVYNQVKGNEKTPEIINTVKELSEEPKTIQEYIILGDLMRHNLEIDADDIYAEALQLAVFAEDPLAFNINDRLNPNQPLIISTNNPPVILPDPQNVHDSNVIDQLHQKCKQLKEETKFNPQMYALFKKTYPDVIDIVNTIENNPCNHERLGSYDSEMLELVISRGQHTWEPLRTNLKNINEDICTTGRIGQIMDALTIIDPIGKPLVTEPILRKEMFDSASAYLTKTGFFEAEDPDSEAAAKDVYNELQKNYATLCSPEIFDKIFLEVKAGVF